MPDLNQMILELGRSADESLMAFEGSAPFPSSSEVGLRHLDTNTGIHLRDDGVLELHAGDATIVMDPVSNSIVFSASNIVQLGGDLRHQADERGFLINNQPLNSFWTSRSIAGNHRAQVVTSTLSTTQFLNQLDSFFVLDTSIVVDKAPTIPLSRLFSTHPLFDEASDDADLTNGLKALLGI